MNSGTRWRRTRNRLRGRLGALGVAVATLGILGGCSSVHESLGTSDAPCFVALPTATAAVAHTGHLAGVRLFKVSALGFRRFFAIVGENGVTTGQVCLVAFTGHFTASSVSRPRGHPEGKFAVVVLRYPSGSLVVTILFAHDPVRFSHTHLG